MGEKLKLRDMNKEKKLLLASPRGFCAGVVRAIETVEKALNLFGKPIYVKHEIVHNRHVVEELKSKGAIFIEDLHEVPEGSRIIYSAHGISPQVRTLAKKRNLIEIDATCGLVTKVHSAVKRYAAKGYQILLIGHKNHVEVIGTAGEAPDRVTIIESVKDVDNLSFSQKDPLFYTTQTTLSLNDVGPIVDAIRQRYPQVQTLPTSSICYATTNRQIALSQIAEEAQLILVVGDRTSSNSNRLKERGVSAGVKSHLIESDREIDPNWFKNVNIVGLTAGASTPKHAVNQCIAKLKTLGYLHIEEVVYEKEEVTFSLPKEVSSLPFG